MMFARTDAGVSNSPMFFGVDYIVYTEGGKKSISVEEYELGVGNDSAMDIGFWRALFEKYGFKKRLRFRAVGSRTTLDHIANKVQSGAVKNTIVVKDRDLDLYVGVSWSSPFIIQTYGYSWENDVWSKDMVIGLLDDLDKSGGLNPAVISEVSQAFHGFWRHVSRLVFLEIGLRGLNNTIIPKAGEQLVDSSGRMPRVKVSRIRHLVKSKRLELARGVTFSIARSAVDSERDCYGKLVQSYCYRVLEVTGRRTGAFSAISIDMANSLAISTYRTKDYFEKCSSRHAYYGGRLSTLKAAAK